MNAENTHFSASIINFFSANMDTYQCCLTSKIKMFYENWQISEFYFSYEK